MGRTQTMPCASEMRSSIPIYPNALPSVPRPYCPSRAASLVLNNVGARQSAVTRLDN